MKKFSFGLAWKSLKDAFKGFSEDKVTKLSASLAYYTVFSLAPLLIVIISLCGFFLGPEAVQGTIDNQLQSFIGADAAKQIQEMIKNASVSGKGTLATVIGVATLLLGATSIFAEVQDSVNGIWGLKAKPTVGIWKTLQTRLLSFGMIGSLAFLLLVSLAATAVIEGLGDRLKALLPDAAVVLFYVINLVLTLSITTVLFGFIFKVLPDAEIKWKDIWPGAVATSLLFLIGKFGISLYVSKGDIGSTYGAAGSLVVLLVWIYYSAIILYFGAEFTKAYALNKGAKIVPSKYAEWDEKPAVAGSQPKGAQTAASGASAEKEPPAPQPARTLQPAPALRSVAATDNPGKKSPGISAAALGLLLYFVTRKKGSPQSGSVTR